MIERAGVRLPALDFYIDQKLIRSKQRKSFIMSISTVALHVFQNRKISILKTLDRNVRKAIDKLVEMC